MIPQNFHAFEKVSRDVEREWKLYLDASADDDHFLSDFNSECSHAGNYSGREILEMLQNADDAGSSKVEINLDIATRCISFRNSGGKTVPFTAEGVHSLLISNLSTKNASTDGKYIGAMGLGFRSLLNWSDHIIVESADIRLTFGSEIVRDRWLQMKRTPSLRSKAEAEAAKNGRRYPLALLRLPGVERIALREDTMVTVYFNEGRCDLIEDNLKRFRPECLLFMRSLRQLVITVDGRRICNYQRSDDAVLSDRVSQCGINDSVYWIVKDCGRWLNQRYEAAAAFDIISPQPSYMLHSFFPTGIKVNIPCILHGTFCLTSNRNGLVSEQEANHEVMRKVAGCVVSLARYIVENRKPADWWAYRMLRQPSTANNGYFDTLTREIMRLGSGIAAVPTISGDYMSDEDTFFYTEGFLDYVKKYPEVRNAMGNMRLSAEIGFRRDRSFAENCAAIARGFSTLEQWVDFLMALDGIAEFLTPMPGILPDNNLRPIGCKAYFNVGEYVGEIPSCRPIAYVAEKVVRRLKNEWKVTEHDVMTRLKRFCSDVHDSKIHQVLEDLLPDRKDSFGDIIALLKVINRYYQGYRLDRSAVAWLPAADGEMKPASALIIPDRFDAMELPYRYPESKILLPSLCEMTGMTKSDFEALCRWLGVNTYVIRQPINKIDDRSYFEQALPNQEAADAYNKQKASLSYRIDRHPFENLGLADAVRLVSSDVELVRMLEKEQEFTYSLHGNRTLHSQLNYVRWQMMRFDVFKPLKRYAVEQKMWLGDEGPTLRSNSDSYLYERALLALGAKRSLREFTVEEIYAAVEEFAKKPIADSSRAPEGAVSFYVAVKDTLFEKKAAGIPASKAAELKLLAVCDGKYSFMPASEIYYWDDPQLPEEISQNLPLFVIGAREGVERVSKYFGTRTLSQLNPKLTGILRNEAVEDSLNADLKQLENVFMALFPGVNPGDIESFRVEVVSEAFYSVTGTCNALLNDNQLVSADKKYYLCSRATSYASLQNNIPAMTAIAEAFCLKMRLRANDHKSKIREILSASDTVRRQQIIDSLLSPAELKKWAGRAGERSEALARRQLRARIDAAVNNNKPKFCFLIHEQLKGGNERQYLEKCEEYRSYPYPDANIVPIVKAQFGVDLETELPDGFTEPVKIERYLKKYGLDYIELPDELKSLVFDEGFDEDFVRYIGQATETDETPTKVGNIVEVQLDIPPDPRDSDEIRGDPKKGLSKREQRRLGLLAEKIVKKSFAADPRYVGIEHVSEDSDNLGSSRLGYDFRYRRADSPDVVRFLEVKASKGYFHLSAHEYRQAIRNSPVYDIALVDVATGEISLLTSPFATGRIGLTPEGYIARVVINKTVGR